MQRLWFITNPASGSATEEKCEALAALFVERGLVLAGRTAFPEQDMPDPAALDEAEVDTVVLFAGDGTINAGVCALADWDGAILILPGGTMNLLAKALHGRADPAEIIHRAARHARRVALPCIEAGPHRALVGLILGPAAHWARAREIVREGRLGRLRRAVGHAWGRTFAGGLRVQGVPGLHHRAQAIFVQPGERRLHVAAVDARDWRSIAALGWEWLTGDWVAAAAVTEAEADSIRVSGNRPVLALFDGEPVTLDPSWTIRAERTRDHFIATADASGV